MAREGYPFILFTAFATLIFALLEYELIAAILLFLTGFVFCFFRDPERIIPDAEDGVVSPADGKIILVEKIFDDRFVHEHVYKVSIFMSVFDVHINRLPFAGEVEKIQYASGSFYAANTDQGALANEHCAVILSTAKDFRYAVVQVAGGKSEAIIAGRQNIHRRGHGIAGNAVAQYPVVHHQDITVDLTDGQRCAVAARGRCAPVKLYRR